MAKAWKIKHSFWWALHQTCILDCTLFHNWEHLGGSCITYLRATRHISVCLNIPIYSKTVSAAPEWIIDGKSRCWVISYDTIRSCPSQYFSLGNWCKLVELMKHLDLSISGDTKHTLVFWQSGLNVNRLDVCSFLRLFADDTTGVFFWPHQKHWNRDTNMDLNCRLTLKMTQMFARTFLMVPVISWGKL